MIFLSRLRSLMYTARKEVRKTKARHNNFFDGRVKNLKRKLNIGSQFILRKDHHPTAETKLKLSQISTGPYNVTDVDLKRDLSL